MRDVVRIPIQLKFNSIEVQFNPIQFDSNSTFSVAVSILLLHLAAELATPETTGRCARKRHAHFVSQLDSFEFSGEKYCHWTSLRRRRMPRASPVVEKEHSLTWTQFDGVHFCHAYFL